MDRRPDETVEAYAKRWLFRHYPRAFGQNYIPLMLGIHRELLANPKLPVGSNVLRKVLYRRTRYDRYLLAMAARDEFGFSAMRHNLKGEPVEPVSEADALAALDAWRRRKKRRQASTPPAPRVFVVERQRRRLARVA